ncbi:MAG: ECF transporter S component [Oscillospiraceae bacterium]|jgi:uncharacterized membrane protein|nr:ECF transporter S component [Oscillospiraceae bacterium]
MKSKTFSTQKLVLLALLTAIVVVLQMAGTFIHFGQFQIALVLLPIVVGAAMCGTLAGGWLGAVFGAVVLFNGDAAAFLQINALGTVILVLLKGICAGLAAGAAYKLFEKKNQVAATIAAAVVSPIVNTGIFTLGCYTIFLPTMREWAGGSDNVTAFIFLTLIGGNFIFEFIVNLILSPAVVRIIKIGESRFGKRAK